MQQKDKKVRSGVMRSPLASISVTQSSMKVTRFIIPPEIKINDILWHQNYL